MHYISFKKTLTLLFVSTTMMGATIYKDTDEKGGVSFSDQPTTNSESVTLEAPNTTQMVQVSPAKISAKEARAEANKSINYQVSILSPKNDEAFGNGVAKITIVVDVSPALKQGHQLQLYLQGAAVGKPQRQKKFSMEDLPRGKYQIYVEVLDATGRAMGQSPTVSIIQHRPSINLPQNPHNPNSH